MKWGRSISEEVRGDWWCVLCMYVNAFSGVASSALRKRYPFEVFRFTELLRTVLPLLVGNKRWSVMRSCASQLLSGLSQLSYCHPSKHMRLRSWDDLPVSWSCDPV